MALGDIYTEKEVDEAIDQLLPVFNQGSGPKIDRDTVRTFVRAENMGSTGGVTFANRRSPADATGVMQVIPSTIKGLKGKYLAPDFPEDLSDAPLSHQVMAGIATIREMVDRTKTTDWQTLAKHYNAGTAVGNGTKPMPKETEGYLLKGARAREMMGIADTPLPPTAATVKPGPAFTSTPLAQASNAYGTMQSLVPAIQSALFGSGVAAQEQGNNQIAAVQVAGQAAAQSAQLQAEIQINEDEFHRKLLKAVGLDIFDPASALNTELQKEAQIRVQREALGKKIEKYESLDFFSNPLEFLAVQDDHRASVAQFNNLATNENRSNQEIARMTALASSLKSLTPAKSADLLRAKAQKDAEALLAKTKFDVAQITEKNAAGQAKNLLDQFNVAGNMFQAALSMEGKEESIEMRRLQFDALLEDRADRAAARKLTAEQKATADAQESALVTGINLYKQAIGGGSVPLTKADIKAMPANIRSAWYEVILRGNYGNSYSEAVPFIKEFGNAGVAASTGNAALVQTVRNIDARVVQKAQDMRNAANAANPLTPMSEKVAYKLAYDQLYAEDAALANKGAMKDRIPPSSPYALDYNAIAVAAAQNPATVVAKVLVDAKNRSPNQSLNSIMTPRMMIEAVKARVVSGEIDPKTAAQEVSNFYKQASDQAYDAAGLHYIGLPRFSDYNIVPGDSKKPVDLYNPSQLENYLTSEVVKEKRLQAMPAWGRAIENTMNPQFHMNLNRGVQ